MIFRLSLLVAASIAVVAVSQINRNSSKKRNSSNIKQSERNGSSFQRMEAGEGEKITDEVSNLLQDEKAQQKEAGKRVRRKIMKQNFQMDVPKELIQNIEKELEKKELILERKLLELYGLEEQKLYSAQLQSNLEDKTAAIDMLNDAIDSLQDEVKNLQEEMRQAVLANTELERAKKTIEKLQLEMDFNASNMKELLVLLEQVSRFQCNKETSINNDTIEKKLKPNREVGLEFLKMQRMNKELELEKRKLALKLVDAQARIKELSNMTEDKIVGKMEEEISILRRNNEGLSKEVEILQSNRFSMVEELVYHRWLNACLRFETENNQTLSGKTSNSDQKVKEVVLNRGFEGISSVSSLTESNDIDSSSTTESSSNSWRSTTKKFGLMHSIKKLVRSNDGSSAASSPSGNWHRRSLLSRTGLIRRHSTSVIPSRPSVLGEITSTITPSDEKMEHESSGEHPDTPTFPRGRRVSFSDSVETCVISTFQDSENIEEVRDDKEMCNKISDKSLVKKDDHPSDSRAQSLNNDSMDEEVCDRIEIAETEKLHSRISSHVAGESKDKTRIANDLATTASLFFLFVLLVWFISYLLRLGFVKL